MSLRTRLIVYLAAIHLCFAVLAVYLLRQVPFALFALELVFAVSLAIGIRLSRQALRSLSLARDAVEQFRERELTSRFLPVGDPDVDALIGVYNDMVDDLRHERVRLQEQQHFLEQVLRVSPSGLVILDLDGRIAELNPAAERLLRIERPRAIGLRPADVASPLAARLAALQPGATEVVALSGPRRVRCHRGTFMDRGFSRGFLVIDEMTEEARTIERAAYEKLIRVMSHEVNNSVTASNSLLQSSLTYSRELAPESRADFERAIGIVIERTEQLRQFMRRFANVFRLPPPHREAHRLEALVEPLIRLARERPDAVDVAWVWEPGDRATQVSVDRGQFEQAFLNILINAVQAAGPGGTVRVRIGAERGRPSLVVEDSGPGLAAEARENVFTPFFSTKPEGQGIGLTLVREILTAHGCEFALDSQPGGPTTFRIVF